MRSRLAFGRVFHKRFRPKVHALQTRYRSLLLDLDEVASLDQRLKLFQQGRFALAAFDEADYGAGTGDLKDWVISHLAHADTDAKIARVQLLTTPRVLGSAFNPINCFFCYDAGEQLRGVLFEVNSTFGERCHYAFAVEDPQARQHHFDCAKTMRVSPFNRTEGTYQFKLTLTGDGLRLGIHYRVADQLVLTAAYDAAFRPLTDAGLIRAYGLVPFSMVKTQVGIHWNALLLWLKGLRFIPARAD